MKILRLKTLEQTFLNLLFPLNCLGCRKEGSLLCPECEATLELQRVQFCPCCEKAITLGGQTCTRCQPKENFFLDALTVAGNYQQTLLAKMVHNLKYNFITNLAEPLGELMVKAINKNSLPLPDFLIPIPLHPQRLRWRGFNQAELLAQYLSTNLAPGLIIPVLNHEIFRAKYTKPQMSVKNYWQRQKNMENAFDVSRNQPADQSKGNVSALPIKNLQGKKILLIDDICTTGSTLNQCAKVLKKLHPHSISACVLARQSF